MKYQISEKCFLLLASIFVVGLPSVAFSDATDATNAPHHAESSIEIEYFNMGSSKSGIGNSQVGTSGVLIQTEYETNNIVFSFNYERWISIPCNLVLLMNMI